jgi:hypothetical protein
MMTGLDCPLDLALFIRPNERSVGIRNIGYSDNCTLGHETLSHHEKELYTTGPFRPADLIQIGSFQSPMSIGFWEHSRTAQPNNLWVTDNWGWLEHAFFDEHAKGSDIVGRRWGDPWE